MSLRALSAAILLTSACCGLHPLPDPLITDPEELARDLSAPPASGTFLGTARAELYIDGKARKGKVEVLVSAPDKVRIDALTFTDDLVSVLAVSRDGFTFYDRGSSHCSTGPLCAAAGASGFPLASQPDSLAALLLGRVPLLHTPDEQRVEFSRENGWYALRLRKGDVEEEIRVHPDGRTVRSVALLVRGKLTGSVTFEGHLDAAGSGSVPEKLRLRAPEPETDFSVTYRAAEFGVAVAGDPFGFKCPEGSDVEYHTCTEASGEQGQVPGAGRN